MATRNLKILVAGSVQGNWSKFIKKINSINKKSGPFELLLCTGSTFGKYTEAKKEWEKCRNGDIKVPIPTYVLGPVLPEERTFYESISLSDGDELSANITYLGRKGVFKTLSGLSVAYISGLQEKSPKDDPSIHFSKSDIDDLVKNVCMQEDFKGVDILLTDVWPAGVTKYTNLQKSPPLDADLISFAASKLKPRYHFSNSDDFFFERPPYRNHQVLMGEQEHVTRFISLAQFGNAQGNKAVYGFSIVPMEHLSRVDLIKQPEGTTEFPLGGSLSSKSTTEAEKVDGETNFFFNLNDQGKRKHDKSNLQRDQGDRPKKAKGPPTLSQPCWFCLGSPKVEKHLVVSIGEHCYLALPKGGLTEDHIMICPIEHHNSTAVIDDEALMEVEKYKESLRRMFQKEGKEIVMFERNFYTQHFQLQVVALPKDKADGLKELFFVHGEEKGLHFTEMEQSKDLKEVIASTTPYFLVELPNGQRLIHRVKGGMPIHFGREVLASSEVLNLPGKVNWKNCKLSLEEETALAKKYRKKYQQYDFNS